MAAASPPAQPVEHLHKVLEERADPIPTILTNGLDTPPAEVFRYSGIGSHLVSAALREALVRADGHDPRTVLDSAREKFFDPLEIDSSGAQEKQFLFSDTTYDGPFSTGPQMRPACTAVAACSGCGQQT